MLLLDTYKKIPLYEQLFMELRKNILSGEMKKDSRLKPIRVMAEELHVSHNTVNHAYQQLLAEGYIRSIIGSGYYVEELHSVKQQQISNKKDEEKRKKLEQSSLVTYDFNPEALHEELAPWNSWKKEILSAITNASYETMQKMESPKGNRHLREELCKYVFHKRGVLCTPDQIIITTDKLHSLEIITSVLPKQEYVIGLENPSDYRLQQFFINKNYKLCPLELLKTGVDVNYLSKTPCNLLYTMPSHQYPTGISLSWSKHLQIVLWSLKKTKYVIEDDTDHAFMFGNEPLLSIQSMDRYDRVIYMDSLSKSLPVGIHCAYLILPKQLLPEYEKQYCYYDSPLSDYEQEALAEYIKAGQLDRLTRKIAVSNLNKYNIMQCAFNKHLSDVATIHPSAGGDYGLIEIHALENVDELCVFLKKKGISIYPISNCYIQKKKKDNCCLMGFASIPEQQMNKACEAFSSAVLEYLRQET